MGSEDLAEDVAVVLVAYFAVGIPLSVYLYHDVIDKRWRPWREVCRFSILYGTLVTVGLVLLCLYGVLQFVAGDYQEGGAAFLSCAIAVYGLYLCLRQASILRFFHGHLQRRANSIISVYTNGRTGMQENAETRCALLFPEGGYEQGPVYGHLSSVVLDDNYPGEGPRVTWLRHPPMVKDWTEMMVRIGLWIRLAVLPASISFDTALRPSSFAAGATDTTNADASDAWTVAIVQQQFLASGRKKSTPKGSEGLLENFIKCVEGEPEKLATWREILRLAPESEWSQALSQFPSGWIEGLETSGIAWEVYLALVLHPIEIAESTESQRPETKDAGGDPNELQQQVEELIRDTVGKDGVVTPAVLMAGFPRADGDRLVWLKRVRQLAEVWHCVAGSMEDDANPLDKKFTEGVDLVIALALLLGADKRSFEFSQSTGQGMNGALKERHKHVLQRVQGSDAEKMLRRSLELCQAREESASDIAQSRYSLGKFLHTQRQYDEARSMYERSIQTWEKLQDPKLQGVLISQADMLSQQGKYSQADSLYLRAIGIAEEKTDPNHPVLEKKRAEVLEKQGKYKEADPSYARVLEGLGATVGTKNSEYASALNDRAGLLKAQGNYEEAERLYKDAIKIWEDNDDPQVATGLSSWAEFLESQGKYDEAEPLLKRALAILEKTHGPGHPDVAAALNKRAGLLKAQGNYELADQLYRRALDIDEKTFGRYNLRLTRDLSNWATMLQAQGRYGEASPLYMRALDIGEGVLGPDHPDVAKYLGDRAGLLSAQGKFTEAEPLYRRALDILGKVLGWEHPDVAEALNNWAGLLKALGKYSEAEALYQRSLAIHKKVYDPGHPKVASDLTNLAELSKSLGNITEAGKLFEQSLNIAETRLGPTHPIVAETLSSQAELLESQGMDDEASSLLQRTLTIRENRLGPEHPRVAAVLDNRADLLKKKGKYDEAEPLYERSQAIREKTLGPGHPDVARSLSNRADLLEKQDNITKAKSLYLESQALREKTLGPEHPDVAQSFSNRAGLLTRQGNYGDAEPLYRHAIEILEAALGGGHPQVALLLEQLAEMFMAQAKYGEAERLYARAIPILEASLGHYHPDVISARNNRAELVERTR